MSDRFRKDKKEKKKKPPPPRLDPGPKAKKRDHRNEEEHLGDFKKLSELIRSESLDIDILTNLASDVFRPLDGREEIKDAKDMKKEVLYKNQVEMFLKSQKEIERMFNGQEKVKVKEVNDLASKLLSPNELKAAKELKKMGTVRANYVGNVVLLNNKLQDIKQKIKDGKIDYKPEVHKDLSKDQFEKALAIYKNEVRDAEEDEKMDEEMEIDELGKEMAAEMKKSAELLNITTLEAKMKQIEKEEAEERRKASPFMADEEEAKKNEEVKKIMDEIEKGKIDNVGKTKLEVIRALVKDVEKLKSSLDTSAKEIKETIFEKGGAVSTVKKSKSSDLRAYVLGHKYLSSHDIVNYYMDLVGKDMKCPDWELVLALTIKSLQVSLDKVATGFLDLKDYIDKKFQIVDIANSIKNRTDKTEATKVIKGEFIEKKDWDKLSKVEKEIKKLGDFAQMPNQKIWMEFSDEEKKKFFELRQDWLIARLSWAVKRAKGERIESNPYGFSDDTPLTKVLTSLLYYADKFANGYYVKKDDWNKYYKTLNEEKRKTYVNLRCLANSVLKKLLKEGKELQGFIKFKNVPIPLKNRCYEEINIKEEAYEIKSVKNKYKREKRIERDEGFYRGRGFRGRGRGGRSLGMKRDRWRRRPPRAEGSAGSSSSEDERRMKPGEAGSSGKESYFS